MQVIGTGSSTCGQSGIPIRQTPKNICDVNPWVCRMTPFEFSNQQSRQPPTVARMTFEPHPRGCNCCFERISQQANVNDDCKSSPDVKKKKKWSRKKSKGKRSPLDDPAEVKRVRLLKENKRREEFVTACCQGLLISPCGSVDSDCAFNDNKEQANFFIKANISPKVQESGKAKPCNSVTSIKKHRADFPCQCRTCNYVNDCTRRCGQPTGQEKTVCYCTDEEKCATDTEARSTATCQPCGQTQMTAQAGGKVLFTAALTQEMLIQLARNGVDMANCIPTKNQYLIDCRSVCAPKAQPESTCRVYNNCDEVLKCEKVGELNCQPDRRCSVYNVQGLQHNRVKCSVMPDCTKIYDVECEQSCRQGNFQNGPYPWGNMYPNIAMPDCAGDMSRPKWWWPPAQERQSSYQENWNRYSSSRRSSDPREGSSRFFLGRPSNYKRSSTQTRDTTTRDKHLSDVSTKTMNPWAYCGPGVETNEMRKDDKKNQKGGKNKNERGGNGHGKRSSMDSTRFDKEPNRSRSPSLLKNLKSTVEQSKMLKSRPSSPPHFDDIEPSNRASGSTKSLYEADMMEAMERVKKRYMEPNYDTTGSSSRATTTTEQCKTPTVKEFMCLTEQIKCLRKELRKYCKSDCP